MAQNVKKYRKLNNFTQAQLAESAGISNTYIANIECGKTWISDTTLENIAKSLHTDFYLFFCDGDECSAEIFSASEEKKFISSKKKELSVYVENFVSDTLVEFGEKFRGK